MRSIRLSSIVFLISFGSGADVLAADLGRFHNCLVDTESLAKLGGAGNRNSLTPAVDESRASTLTIQGELHGRRGIFLFNSSAVRFLALPKAELKKEGSLEIYNFRIKGIGPVILKLSPKPDPLKDSVALDYDQVSYEKNALLNGPKLEFNDELEPVATGAEGVDAFAHELARRIRCIEKGIEARSPAKNQIYKHDLAGGKELIEITARALEGCRDVNHKLVKEAAQEQLDRLPTTTEPSAPRPRVH